MDSNKVRILDILLIIFSIIAVGFSLVRVVPFECSSETYIGVLVTLLGIGVTLVIGYQILNVVEIRNKIEKQSEISKKLLIKNKHLEQCLTKKIKELKKKSEEQEHHNKKRDYEIDEQLDVLRAYNSYNSNAVTHVGDAFLSLHHSLIYGIHIEDNDFSLVFFNLRKYLSEMDKMSIGIVGGITKGEDGIPYIFDGTHKTYVYDCVDSYCNRIYETENTIKQNANFYLIEDEYNKIMRHFRIRMEWLRVDPNKILTEEEKQSIFED